ncbi:MAG TPA: hypothetical protein DDW94_05025 [Deltaproteobacteria bacterium]|nr:hypothetical protein [Deltaproteobacteria bacterium]HCY09834.1 hypothetical protein [Deltaproteobacteria bacterium]
MCPPFLFLSYAEVAEIFKRFKKTIYRWREEGIFREVIQVKDGYLIPEREVLMVIEENTKLTPY